MSKRNAVEPTERGQSVAGSVEITDAIMPGVVSIPHGWGHTLPRTKMHIAIEHSGVNTNVLTDEEEVDPLSGNAVLNGVPVPVQKVLTASRHHAS